MRYGNIPEEILQIELGEFWNDDLARPYSLQEELDTVDESIIEAVYDLGEESSLGYSTLKSFTAWTENYVLQLVNNEFSEQTIITIPRNPIRQTI